MAKEGFGGPGVSTPAAIGDFVNFFYYSAECYPTTIGPTARVSHEDFHTWVLSRSYGNRQRNQQRGVGLPLKAR